MLGLQARDCRLGSSCRFADELVLEVADATVESLVSPLRTHMVEAAALAVPLKVDVGVGLNWDQAH